MQQLHQILQLASLVAFGFYGTTCIFSKRMKIEFERYRLERFRVVNGVFQVLGSLGQALGFWFPVLLLLASLGFAVLMFMGVIVRLRLKDPWFAILPAFILCGINLALCAYALELLGRF